MSWHSLGLVELAGGVDGARGRTGLGFDRKLRSQPREDEMRRQALFDAVVALGRRRLAATSTGRVSGPLRGQKSARSVRAAARRPRAPQFRPNARRLRHHRRRGRGGERSRVEATTTLQPAGRRTQCFTFSNARLARLARRAPQDVRQQLPRCERREHEQKDAEQHRFFLTRNCVRLCALYLARRQLQVRSTACNAARPGSKRRRG